MKLRVLFALLTLGSIILAVIGIGFADTKDGSGFLKDDIVIKKSAPHDCSKCCCGKRTDHCDERCLRSKGAMEFAREEKLCRAKAAKDKTLNGMCDALGTASVQTNEGCIHECDVKKHMEDIMRFLEEKGYEFFQ